MAGPGALLHTIPEFSATRSIKIAPNTAVPVTERLLHLIDSKTFQRLRRIRQLSLSERVFPSATHTRFSHALGVYVNILDYLRHMDQFPEFYGQFNERDYLGIMLAGLLHDIGHYPFTHQVDHMADFPEHEHLTVALIRGELRLSDENLCELIRDTFGLEPDDITRFLLADRPLAPHERLLSQLIDSPVDADKCDYLPRDSYYCGVDYGAGFDRERFIRNLVPSKDGKVLAVREKGLMSAERFQLARYWMYRSVYWGHTVRAFITMLSKACEFLRVPMPGDDWHSMLLGLDDQGFLDWLEAHVDPPGDDLIAMINRNRQPYKRVYTLSAHHNLAIYERMQQAETRARISRWITQWAAQQGLDLAEHHLIWDVPPPYKNETWETFPIRLSEGREVPVAEESPVVEALGQAFLSGVRKIRLFCHPKLVSLMDASQNQLPPITDLLD